MRRSLARAARLRFVFVRANATPRVLERCRCWGWGWCWLNMVLLLAMVTTELVMPLRSSAPACLLASDRPLRQLATCKTLGSKLDGSPGPRSNREPSHQR